MVRRTRYTETVMQIMALDVGQRRIGVSLSDPLGVLATPVAVVQRRALRKDLDEIARLAIAHEVERILIGLPISLDGVARSQAQWVERFGDALTTKIRIPVSYQDERFTTLEAQRRLREAGIPARKQKQLIDASAATVLLQSYLDGMRRDGIGA